LNNALHIFRIKNAQRRVYFPPAADDITCFGGIESSQLGRVACGFEAAEDTTCFGMIESSQLGRVAYGLNNALHIFRIKNAQRRVYFPPTSSILITYHTRYTFLE
jgi:hypothetical protein